MKKALVTGLGVVGASASTALAAPSAYVTEFGTASTQIIEDVAAVLPYALAIMAVVFGVRILRGVFKASSR